MVYSEASYPELGCVSMQNGKVVAYVSRQQKSHETNYPTYDLQLAVGVLHWKYGVINSIGKPFLICMDLKSLKYLMDHKEIKHETEALDGVTKRLRLYNPTLPG